MLSDRIRPKTQFGCNVNGDSNLVQYLKLCVSHFSWVLVALSISSQIAQVWSVMVRTDWFSSVVWIIMEFAWLHWLHFNVAESLHFKDDALWCFYIEKFPMWMLIHALGWSHMCHCFWCFVLLGLELLRTGNWFKFLLWWPNYQLVSVCCIDENSTNAQIGLGSVTEYTTPYPTPLAVSGFSSGVVMVSLGMVRTPWCGDKVQQWWTFSYSLWRMILAAARVVCKILFSNWRLTCVYLIVLRYAIQTC